MAQQIKSNLNEQEQSQNFMCGLGSWQPKWLQKMATMKAFMFVFGGLCLIQGASFTYLIASITTLEKRYSFGSKVSGLIFISENLMELIGNPLFGYLANRVHRPRMIGICQIITAFSCFLGALPYFIYGPGLHLLGSDNVLIKSVNRSVEYCDANRDRDFGCDDNTDSNTVIPAVVLLCLSSFSNGIGFIAFYTIGFPFIDDNVRKRDSPLYMSIIAMLRLCGPTAGFMLSSLCLQYYEDPFIDPGISDRKDPRWIGAWWIGFIVIGIGIIIFALPLFLFPAQFRNTLNNKANTKSQLVKVNKASDESIWKRIMKLMKNPIYMCYLIGTNARVFAVLGYMTFKSKYMENEYKKSASVANFFSGAIGVVPTAIGIFLGGLFIRQLQPGPKTLTSFITIVEIIGAMGLISALFLGCPQSKFAGAQLDTSFSSELMCNDNCFCTERVFQPICGPDNQTNYFSPCFAGCSPDSLIQNSSQTNQYSNCKCLSGPATEGYCETDCGNNFDIYIILMGISNIIGASARSGNTIIEFRIVDPKDKSFSIGLMGSIMCLFAFIPYPLVYGAVTDAACLVWKSSCGEQGNCWIYDSDKFRKYLHGVTLILYFIGSLFDIIVIFLSNRIKNLYDDNDVNEECSPNLMIRSTADRHLAFDESEL